MPRFPAAQYQPVLAPCPGRSSLGMGCAPAEHGSYQEARKGKISQVRVSTLSGEPRHASLVWRPAPCCVALWPGVRDEPVPRGCC
jgi:hypothetical protein